MDSGWHMWPWLINITSVSELHKLLLRRVSYGDSLKSQKHTLYAYNITYAVDDI